MQKTTAISSEQSLTALISGHKTGKLLRFQEMCCCFPTLQPKPWELLSLVYVEPWGSRGESDPSQPGPVSAEWEEEMETERAGWMMTACLRGIVCIPSSQR